MSVRGNGLLAIWSDVSDAVEIDYRHWFSREHVLERVGVDGFVAGRVFRHVNADLRRYFFAYELENSNAVSGPSYLARLNAPTPWSQRVMPVLQNFARGGGSILARAGMGQGGVVSPLRFDLNESLVLNGAAACQAFVQKLASMDGISSVWLMSVDVQATTLQTKEKSMRRSVEDGFNALLCMEGLTTEQVQYAAQTAIEAGIQGVPEKDIPIFRLCYALDKRLANLTT